MSWADLDKALVKTRGDGATTLVVRDDRTRERVLEARHLSIIVAISRVVRAREALGQRYGGRGSVVYLSATTPPDLIVDAVTAAGGTVFDGVREHRARSPHATTVQLDAAFSDLGSAVRRRFSARTFGDALETLERALRTKIPERTNVEAWWTAIIELAALTGECIREKRAARWVEAPTQRFPLALDLGKTGLMFPGKLAQTIVEGGGGSMRGLFAASEPAATPVGGVPMMPLLCDRRAVPIEKLTWEKLLSDEADTEDVPVIAYVEDRGGTMHFPFGGGAPTPELRARALANLAKEPFQIERADASGGLSLVTVLGSFYAAESLLVPAIMAKVRAELGGPKLMFVGVPARGELLAIDGERALLDQDLETRFLMILENRYLESSERNRISREAIVYDDKPLGRVERR